MKKGEIKAYITIAVLLVAILAIIGTTVFNIVAR